MKYNYLLVHFEQIIDNAFEFIHSLNITNANNNLYILQNKQQLQLFEIFEKFIVQINLWKYIFDEFILLYIVLLLQSKFNIKHSDDQIVYFGFSTIKLFIDDYYKFQYDTINPKLNQIENIHMKIKHFILENLFTVNIKQLTTKYIDIFFETIEYNAYEYISPIDFNQLDIYRTLTLYDFTKHEITTAHKLNYLTKNNKIKIMALFIQLTNNIYNKINFDNVLKEKQNKLLEIFNKIPKTYKGAKFIHNIINKTDEFSIPYDFNSLSKLNINIPFITIDSTTETFEEYIMIYVNNVLKINTQELSAYFILYRDNGVETVVTMDQIDKIYKIELLRESNYLLEVLPDIKYLKYFTNINYNYLFKYINKYITKLNQNILDNIENEKGTLIRSFISQIYSNKMNIVIEPTQIKYICIHQIYFEKLQNAKSLKEYKLFSTKINDIIDCNLCTICGQILNNDNIVEDNIHVVLVENLDKFTEYYKYKDFIQMTELLIQKFGQIFNNSNFTNTQNNDHKNFIIQNIISITDTFRFNEDYCKNAIKQSRDILHFNDSSFFIFSITNNLFIANSIVDLYKLQKFNNIYIIIILFFILYYNIDIDINKYVEIKSLYDMCHSKLNKLTKFINISVTDDFVQLIAYITFILLRYQRWSIQEKKLTFVDRIKKYASQIIETICDYIFIIKSLADKGIVSYLYARIKKKLRLKIQNSNIIISTKYDNLIKSELKLKLFIKKIYYKFEYNNNLFCIFSSDFNKYIFCKSGHLHFIEKGGNSICSKCHTFIYKEINNNLITFIKSKIIKIDNPIYNQLEFNNDTNIKEIILEMNKSNITDIIKYNINNSETNMYNKITLKREILKIEIDQNLINISTNSIPISLYWISNKLMNLEFPNTKLNINFNPIGILFFNDFKTNYTFTNAIRLIFETTIQKQIVPGLRTKLKHVLDIVNNATEDIFNKYSTIKIFNPIHITNNSNNVKCILLNNFNYFYNYLALLLFILHRDKQLSTILADFILNINTFIETLQINTNVFIRE